MSLLNYTTKVPAEQSAMEIQKMLVRAGAKAIMQEYDDQAMIAAISFQLALKDGTLAGFKLPTNWRPVQVIMERDRKTSGNPAHRGITTANQAQSVAWRITKDWVEAQLAIIETSMVEAEQVFLPYLLSPGGKTVYEYFKEDPRFLLGSGGQQ